MSNVATEEKAKQVADRIERAAERLTHKIAKAINMPEGTHVSSLEDLFAAIEALRRVLAALSAGLDDEDFDLMMDALAEDRDAAKEALRQKLANVVGHA